MSSGTVIDAGVLIGLLQSDDAHHRSAHKAFRQLVATGEQLYLSAVTYAEVMVRPMREGQGAAAETDLLINDIPGLDLVPPDRSLSQLAALVRAVSPKLELADAFVVATARSCAAETILTTDQDFQEIPNAVLLSDFVR